MSDATPRDYWAVRVQFVHVHRGTFGFKETVKGYRIVIPDNLQQAATLASSLFDKCDDASKRLNLVEP